MQKENGLQVRKDSKFNTLTKAIKETFSLKAMKRDFKALTKVDWALLTILVITQISAFIYSNDFSPIGITGFVTGIITIISLILVNKGLSTNYVWGTMGSLVWLVIAIDHRLIGDVSSQMFYFVMQFVGIYAWYVMMSKTGSDHVQGKKLTKGKLALIVLVTVVIYTLVVLMSKGLNGNQILLDATLLPLGMVGQLLMTYGYRSQWFFWVTLNAINVVIWYNQLGTNGSATSMFVLQIVMLINSLYGAYQWGIKGGESD